MAGAIVGLSPQIALDKLNFVSNKSAKMLIEAIQNAKANAKNNLKLDESKLKIKKIEVGKGPFFKRWQPVSRGMAHQIKKRTTHVRIFLEEVIKEEKNGKKS